MTAMLIASVSCSPEPITVTTVKKQKANSAYEAPNHWQLQGSSGMRALSFSIPDDHGHNGEVSVLPMPKLNIADLEVVNLWRQQVGLTPATEDQLPSMATSVAIGGGTGKLFDLASPDASEDPDHAPRIVTAYLHEDDLTWFFKLTGPSHFVENEKPAFEQFLSSINLAKMRNDMQRRSAAQQMPQPSPGGAGGGRPTPEWTVPESWTATTPSSSMLLAAFEVKNPTAGPANVTVSSLGGGGGGLVANINRWRGQIGLSSIGPDDLSSITSKLDLNGLEATLVDMASDEQRIVAAIVPVGSQTWFYKMMGSPQTIENEIQAFTQFVQSVKYSGNG